MARPKKEYEERPPDKDGTPFQRFEEALKKVIRAPKSPPQQGTQRKA